jgi:hypothetical protein
MGDYGKERVEEELAAAPDPNCSVLSKLNGSYFKLLSIKLVW